MPKDTAADSASSPVKSAEDAESATNKFGDTASADSAEGSDDAAASSDPEVETDHPFADHPQITREQIEKAVRNRE